VRVADSTNFHTIKPGGVRAILENTGNMDLVYMEVFRADRFEEVLLSDWLARSPIDMVAETLNLDPSVIADLDPSVIAQFPRNRPAVVPV
jgi:oxalate decarboxylase